MSKDIKSLAARLVPLLTNAKRYVVLIFLVTVCAIYGFLAYRINVLTRSEPAPDAISEKLETVARPRIDQNAVDKMNQLEEENIEVRALFQEARNDPFSE